MNVCFYTSYEVSPIQGGTERITHTVAKGLRDIYGWKCYSIYSFASRTGKVSDVFESSAKIVNPQKQEPFLESLLQKWEIHVFVNQGVFYLSGCFAEIMQNLQAKYIFCHHFEPGWELHSLSISSVVMRWKKTANLKNFLKIWLYPYYKIRQKKGLSRLYGLTYHLADKVILLSERFIPQFKEFGGISDSAKFAVIHNSLSFTNFYDINQLDKKEKIVLIVSRMEDTQKKISLALKIWERVEECSNLSDWSLHLVGIGQDLKRYKQYVKKNHLRRVVFEGAQPSERFYQEASLFMMTSESEGWGLTLTEAQQYGCVPLAFDTYASLHEIISDGYNGFIIPKDNVERYVEQLKELMSDERLRKRLAKDAVESSHRFEQNKIIEQWQDLLQNI